MASFRPGLIFGVLMLGCSPVRHIKTRPLPPTTEPSATARAHYLRGQVLHARGELEAATVALSTARMFDPDEPRILLAMAQVALTASEIQTARAHAVSATRIDPEHADAWHLLGRLEQAFGDPAAAKTALERTLDLDGRWEARSALIGLALRAQDAAGAVEQLQTWSALQTEDPVELEKRGQLRAVTGDTAGAAEDWLALFAVGGGTVRIAESLVQAAIESGETAAVILELESWLRSAPVRSPGWVAYGLLCATIGDWAEAIDALERMEAAGKLGSASQATLGLVRSTAKDMKVRLTIDGSTEGMEQIEAWLAAGQLEDAERRAWDGLRAQPGHPGYWDALGWILFKQGRRDAALRVLDRALRLAPDDEAVRAHRDAVLASRVGGGG